MYFSATLDFLLTAPSQPLHFVRCANVTSSDSVGIHCDYEGLHLNIYMSKHNMSK